MRRQSRRKPENRFSINLTAGLHLAEGQVRTETHPHNLLRKRIPMASPVAAPVPSAQCWQEQGATASAQEDVKAFTREQRSPESSAHHHTKGGSCLCSPPVTATGRWFSNEVTMVWFRHPLPKAMPGAGRPHCPPPPDGCWMQRGHHISCSLLVPVALPPPPEQSHTVRLGSCHTWECSARRMERNAQDPT